MHDLGPIRLNTQLDAAMFKLQYCSSMTEVYERNNCCLFPSAHISLLLDNSHIKDRQSASARTCI